MKRSRKAAFTLVELIVVIAILAILLCIAVPNMMNYMRAAHRAAAKTDAQISADAVQRYLDDQKDKGTLSVAQVRKLMDLDLSDSQGPLSDYIAGGQKEARIVSVSVDMESGRLRGLEYKNRYCKVLLSIDEEGNRTLEDDIE